jgi:cell division GTPase FtsZ
MRRVPDYFSVGVLILIYSRVYTFARLEAEGVIPDTYLYRPKIVVIGVGGAGGNALNSMIRNNILGVVCAL